MDTEWREALKRQINNTRRVNDNIAPTLLRQYVDEMLTCAYNALLYFDQEAYEQQAEHYPDTAWKGFCTPKEVNKP